MRKKFEKNLKKNKGITIISLVVTIIILIILAGVSINLVIGQNGIITKAQEAKENIEIAQIEEQHKLNELIKYFDNYEEGELGSTEISSDVVPKLVDALKYSELGVTEENTFDEICQKLKEAYPELPIGTTYNFAYTGNVQEWTCECSGFYKLETYGAQGGTASLNGIKGTGGLGGYSIGYLEIKKGTTLYVVVGGAGEGKTTGTATGGYNGGGSVKTDNMRASGSGGGATHIATITGILSSLSNEKDKILIVSGGGGGATSDGSARYGNGGSGGGNSGGSGSSTNGYSVGGGGTQTTGGSSSVTTGSFGQGGNTDYTVTSAGGGGYYGGGAGKDFSGGGGGSGYIGGVPEVTYKEKIYSPSSLNGNNSGNGKAIITFIAY